MTHQRVGVLLLLGAMTLTFIGSAAYVLLGNPFEPDAINLPPLTVDEAADAIRLRVTQTGIAVVSPADLQRARLPYSEFSPQGLSLTRDGQPVPFHVAGDGDGARLYFYGIAMTQTMAAPSIYWLSPGKGAPVAHQDARPAGRAASLGWQHRTWEENIRFKPESTGSDPWLGQTIYAPGSLEIPLTDIQPSGGPARLVLRVWSGTQSSVDPDHHLEIHVNDHRLTSFRWDGIREVTVAVPLPAGVLQLGDNTLHLRLPGDTGAASDAVYVDWIRLEYESLLDQRQGQLLFGNSLANLEITGATPELLVFDVTDPHMPLLLTGAGYDEESGSVRIGGAGARRTYASANPQQAHRPNISVAPVWARPLRDPKWGADYLAIVPPYAGLDEALRPLLAHREESGLRIETVSAEQIYDEFAFGRATPEAIRSFIHYARDNWEPPAPSFILLVGDASYEPANVAATPHPSLLPSPLAFTEAGGRVASDSWYMLLPDGTLAPEAALGRLPVRNREQLDVIVSKTLAYETAGDAQWRSRAVLVADDEGRFETSSNRLAGWLDAAGFETQRLHMSESKDLRDAIIGMVNQGAGLINYAGYGNLDAWGAEAILQNSDVRLLLNSDWLPILTTFSSLNGLFNHPTTDSLAETLLWNRSGGIVAAVAPSGRTLSWQQTPVSDGFFRVMLSGEAKTVGDALLQAKLLALREPYLQDVVHSFNLLGDPALGIYLPPR
jgi:hypothetical protein